MNKETFLPEKLQIAFRKLQAYVYFDKNDLHLRNKLALWIDNLDDEKIDQKLLELATTIETDKLSEFINLVTVHIMPKKVVPDLNECEEKKITDVGVFFSNTRQIENSRIEKLSVFIDLPIELHIITILWLMEYGGVIEKSILKHNYGNRLFLNDSNEIGSGRILFKPYQDQFPKWWNNAIKEANNLLSKEEDVTILNLDFKSFFHTVRLDFKIIEEYLEQNGKNTSKDPVHEILKRIHVEYLNKIKNIGFQIAVSENEGKYPLPIGLLSSHVLANFYMKEFDEKILESLNPVYYGRYVDDILIVFKDRILKSDASNPLCNPIEDFFKKYMLEVLVQEEQNFKVALNDSICDYSNLILQTNKVAIYQFDKNLSANLLNKFAREQEKRNYIFHFLSDETDELFNEFEIDAFEESFEEISAHNSRFKPQELNKFRFAVYIAKLIKRRMLNNAPYKDEEIDKIFKYFQGTYLLQNYVYWEKLLTLYTIANKPDYFSKTLYKIEKEIKNIQFKNVDESNNLEHTQTEIKKYLTNHLEYSCQMAIGLNPTIFQNKSITESKTRSLCSLCKLESR